MCVIIPLSCAGTMMGAFAEGMALCSAADLPMDTLLKVSTCRMLRTRNGGVK